MSYDPSKIAFVDTETTGLDLERHEIWECAIVLPDEPVASEYQCEVDLGRADVAALLINDYYERTGRINESSACVYRVDAATSGPITRCSRAEVADLIATDTHGRWLVGMNVAFDMYRLERLLRANGACPSWNYHPVDVEVMMAVELKAPPPWRSEDLSLALGIDPAAMEVARHTALGDALWAKACFEKIMGLPS